MKINTRESKRESDPQRQKEYDWEVEKIEPELPEEDMPLEQCSQVARVICKRHGVSAPWVLRGIGRKSANSLDFCYEKNGRECTKHLMQLPKGGRNLITVVHECCHFLKHKYDEDCSHHGPVFVRILIDEIVRLGMSRKLTKKYLEETARAAGLLVCDRRRFNYKNRELGVMPRACTECMRMHPRKIL